MTDNQSPARWLVVAAVLGVLAINTGLPQKLLGQTQPQSQADYSGPLRDLRAAAAKMAPEHRAAMSEAFAQAGQSLRSDTLGLVATTGQWQRAMEGALQFGYRDGGRVDTRYPEVASLIQAELSRVAGPDDVKIADPRPFYECPAEISRAVR